MLRVLQVGDRQGQGLPPPLTVLLWRARPRASALPKESVRPYTVRIVMSDMLPL